MFTIWCCGVVAAFLLVNCTAGSPLSPLIQGLAATTRQDNLCRVGNLLRQNPDLDINQAADQFGSTLLHLASERGSVELVKLLLTHPDIDVNRKDVTGATPFFWACFMGNHEVVRRLIEDSRVRINEANQEDQETPIYWAAFFGDKDTLLWLVAAGRKIDFAKGKDVIAAALDNGHQDVAAMLGKFKDDQKAVAANLRRLMDLGDIPLVKPKKVLRAKFTADLPRC